MNSWILFVPSFLDNEHSGNTGAWSAKMTTSAKHAASCEWMVELFVCVSNARVAVYQCDSCVLRLGIDNVFRLCSPTLHMCEGGLSDGEKVHGASCGCQRTSIVNNHHQQQ
jgi:hypothetical protein